MTEIVFPVGFLFIAIFAAAYMGSHNRSPLKDSLAKAAPAEAGTSEPTTYRKEAFTPSNRWVPHILLVVITFCAFRVVGFLVDVEHRLDAARGTPRPGMAEGRYRVLYRNPDGSGALIKTLATGTTLYYANHKSSPPRDPNYQYCFEVRAGSCNSYSYTIACPQE